VANTLIIRLREEPSEQELEDALRAFKKELSWTAWGSVQKLSRHEDVHVVDLNRLFADYPEIGTDW